MENLNQKLLSLLFSISRLLKERSLQENKINPYTVLHLHTLGYISEHQTVSMREVANFLLITPPSATVLVNNMVKSGWLKRLVNKKDRRGVWVQLTGKGNKVLSEHRKKISKMVSNRLNLLSLKQKNELIKILQRLI